MPDGIIKLSRDIEELVEANLTPIHILPLFINKEFMKQDESFELLMEKLHRRAELKQSVLTYSFLDQDVVSFSLKLRQRRIPGKLYFNPKKEIVYLVISKVNESYTQYDAMIVARKFYPLTFAPIISYQELFSILDLFTKQYNIVVKQYLLRKRKRQLYTTKEWTAKTYIEAKQEILEIIKQKKSVLDALKFYISNDLGLMAQIRIDRFGVVSIYESTPLVFRNIVKFILDEFVGYATAHYQEYKKVKIIEAKESELPEIISGIFEFESELPPADFDILVDTLKKSYYIAINYQGNPWMDLDLIDSEDGSRFKLIVDESRAKIIPDFNSRPTSLQTLVELLNSVIPGKFEPTA